MPYIGNITSDFSVDTGNITNRAVTALKLSPASVGSNGQVLSVDGSGNLQWGNDANAPEGTAVLSTGESGTTKYLRVDGDGTCSWQLAVDATKTTLTGSTNNTITTVTGANAIEGEANLTFNNSALSIINTSNLGDAFLYIKAGEAGASVIELQADEADDNNDLWRIQNAGDSILGFRSKTSGSWVEKLGITADGHVGIGVTPSAWPTNADSIALQIGTGFAAFGRGSGDEDRGGIAVNYYTNGTDNKYIANGHSNRVYMNDGNIDFQYAPSGNAGNNITFTSGIRMKADGNVGIGTTSPLSKLHIVGSDDQDNFKVDVSGSEFVIHTDTTDGEISLRAQDGSGNNYAKYMTFFTHPGGSAAEERLRIDSSGRVLIGDSSSNIGDGILQVYTADKKHPAIKINSAGSNGFSMLADAYLADESQVNIGVAYSTASLVLSTSVKVSDTAGDEYISSQDSFAAKPCALKMNHQGVISFLNTNTSAATTTDTAVPLTERFSIEASGNVQIHDGDLIIGTGGHGIDFSAQTTSSASGATAATSSGDETLDHYEKGTWTPTDASGQSLTFSYGHRWYIRIGDLVHINFYISYPVNTDSTLSKIGGLPFTAKANNYFYLNGRVAGQSNGVMYQVNEGSTYIEPYVNDSRRTNANLSGCYMLISGCYQI